MDVVSAGASGTFGALKKAWLLIVKQRALTELSAVCFFKIRENADVDTLERFLKCLERM